MATDIAANSDSTLTNSQGARRPSFTSLERPSTMWVCGEMGYAQMTSGRHMATASATATEPSICLSNETLLPLGEDQMVCGARGLHVAVGDVPGEALADRVLERGERDDARRRGECAEQRRAGHRPAEVLARDLRRRHREEALGGLRGVEDQACLRRDARQQLGQAEQRRVLDDDGVGVGDRLARAD